MLGFKIDGSLGCAPPFADEQFIVWSFFMCHTLGIGLKSHSFN